MVFLVFVFNGIIKKELFSTQKIQVLSLKFPKITKIISKIFISHPFLGV